MDQDGLEALIVEILRCGYDLKGPTVQSGAIVLDSIRTVHDLPIGWTEEQKAGTYRLKRRDDQAIFGFNNGPHSWKKFLFPPRTKLWSASRSPAFTILPNTPVPTKLAFLGVRSCDLQAILTQDKVFIGNAGNEDPLYKSLRESLLIVAVNCSQAAATCFCTSTDTGPKTKANFDLALTEIRNGTDSSFVVELGSEKGAQIIGAIPTQPCNAEDLKTVAHTIQATIDQIVVNIDSRKAREQLAANPESPHWDTLETRCLACANCTLVCPTCFCSKVEDTTDLTGDHAERWRTWDSCFSKDFSYIHGGHVRESIKSRYRQWLTHKFSSWWDQFGSSGCVGCGRCVAWCPVGIDITEEIGKIVGDQ
jgi:sulfhydrogenase subunit beta (sulfur reductase)